MKYRHELKYIISNKQADLLKLRLKDVLKYDKHYEDGSYRIRSLYLDDFKKKLLLESLDGLNNRSKYRIRFYNSDQTIINLEKKSTINDLKCKTSVKINKSDIVYFLKNKILNGDDLISAEVKANHYYPKTIIEYDRLAFVNEDGNVRITIDSNINANESVDDFLKEKIYGRPVLPINRKILEVKYDGILPGYISRILNVESLERASYSKYIMSNNVLENNGRIEEVYEY